jgi:glutamate--cysteine ligase
LLYDSVALDAACDLVKDRRFAEMMNLRDDVPKLAFQAPFRKGEVRDVAREMVAIAQAGLKRRRRLDRAGESDESHFLDALAEFVASGRCPAQEKLEKFHGPWGGKIDPLFTEYAF